MLTKGEIEIATRIANSLEELAREETHASERALFGSTFSEVSTNTVRRDLRTTAAWIRKMILGGRQWANRNTPTKPSEIIEALGDMVGQYCRSSCDDGSIDHQCMSAGEHATDVLVDLGLMTGTERDHRFVEGWEETLKLFDD